MCGNVSVFLSDRRQSMMEFLWQEDQYLQKPNFWLGCLTSLLIHICSVPSVVTWCYNRGIYTVSILILSWYMFCYYKIFHEKVPHTQFSSLYNIIIIAVVIMEFLLCEGLTLWCNWLMILISVGSVDNDKGNEKNESVKIYRSLIMEECAFIRIALVIV